MIGPFEIRRGQLVQRNGAFVTAFLGALIDLEKPQFGFGVDVLHNWAVEVKKF